MLHNGYMYVIEHGATEDNQSPSSESRKTSYATIAGSGNSKGDLKNNLNPRFVPVAEDMPDGVDVERMYPSPYNQEGSVESSENQSDSNSTEVAKVPSSTKPSKPVNKENHQKDNNSKTSSKNIKNNNNSNNNIPQENNNDQINGYAYQHYPKNNNHAQQIHAVGIPPPYHMQQMPANYPVVYMMPAPGQYAQHPGQYYQPQPWQQFQQMPGGPPPPGGAYVIANPYQHPQGYYHDQAMGPGFGHPYHGPPQNQSNQGAQKYNYKRNSVNYDHTFNPLKGKSHQGPIGAYRHNNKDKVKEKHHDHKKATSTEKDSIPKKTKSLQSSSTDPKNSTTSRSNSTNSDLSLGCSASQNGSNHRHSRSCSHDSGVSHKTPPDNSNHSQTGSACDDGKASITATVNGGRCDSHESAKSSSSRRFSNNGEFKKPEEDLVKKIIDLIEFYLSDEYLAKDKYLLRQIRCKSEGYISIKLMTSFKKVKKLTRDWRTVRYALLKSANLEISPEGFRVKRAIALPDALRKPRLLSSVVSIRLPLEYQSVDAITNLFSKYGEIGLVRLLKPGKEIPSDLRNYATQVPDIGKSLCAVVDFEQSEAALQAVRCLKEKLIDCGMRLALLGPRVRRTLYKQDRADGDTNSTRSDCDEIQTKSEKTASHEETTTGASDSLRMDSNEHSTSNSKTTSHDDCEHDHDEDDVEAEVNVQVVPVEEIPASVVIEGATSTLATVNEDDEEVPQKNTSFDSGTAHAAEATEVVKIKSKVSIILREPKCPPSSTQDAGFTRARNTE